MLLIALKRSRSVSAASGSRGIAARTDACTLPHRSRAALPTGLISTTRPDTATPLPTEAGPSARDGVRQLVRAKRDNERCVRQRGRICIGTGLVEPFDRCADRRRHRPLHHRRPARPPRRLRPGPRLIRPFRPPPPGPRRQPTTQQRLLHPRDHPDPRRPPHCPLPRQTTHQRQDPKGSHPQPQTPPRPPRLPPPPQPQQRPNHHLLDIEDSRTNGTLEACFRGGRDSCSAPNAARMRREIRDGPVVGSLDLIHERERIVLVGDAEVPVLVRDGMLAADPVVAEALARSEVPWWRRHVRLGDARRRTVEIKGGCLPEHLFSQLRRKIRCVDKPDPVGVKETSSTAAVDKPR